MAHPIKGFVHRGGIASAKQDQAARLGAGALQQLGFFLIAEVVFDGADGVDLAALAYADKRQAAGTSFLGFAEHITAGLDAHIADLVIATGHGDALDRATSGNGTGEHLEAHVGNDVADAHQLHAVAGIGAIGAVALHGLMPGHARQRQRQLDSFHHLPDAGDQALIEIEDLLLIQEAHLHVQLGEFRLAIGPEVFVAEAAGHLVVALQSAHHQQLFEQLW